LILLWTPGQKECVFDVLKAWYVDWLSVRNLQARKKETLAISPLEKSQFIIQEEEKI